MDLTDRERIVLTLANDITPEELLEAVNEFFKVTEDDLDVIIDKLVNLGLIEVVNLGKFCFFHTKQVKREMLDSNAYYYWRFGKKMDEEE